MSGSRFQGESDLLGVSAVLVELDCALVVLDCSGDCDRVADCKVCTTCEAVALDLEILKTAADNVDGDVAVLLAVGCRDLDDCSGDLSCTLECLAVLKLIGLEQGLD